MKIVIQCASKKRQGAGCMRNRKGEKIYFVANPVLAPVSDVYVYAKPDDIAEDGLTWRDILVIYNNHNEANEYGLFKAYRLYMNVAYNNLVNKYSEKDVFILSAGWGLIGAGFLIPRYDITFSASADKYKKRKINDKYHDFCQLSNNHKDDLVFFGGKDYLPLFQKLTSSYKGRRIIFYNSKKKPESRGCYLKHYQTTTRTNWHYECIKAFLRDELSY